MSDIAVKVEDIGKCYQIGQSKSGDFRQSFGSWIDKIRGRSNGQEAAESKEFWALKDINFEIKKGEAVGIIGRNGAGKSTLLKILSRITEPTKGRFEINGRVSSLLEVGTGFHPELSGRENIYLNGTILGMKRREIKGKFDEIVAFSGVEKFIDTPVKHYSSGMKVRLAFSVAAHLDPEILIIDEVLAVGDAEFQKKCLGKMGEVTSQGRTVVFVSHDLQAISTLTKNCIILNQGIVAFQGPSNDAVKFYLSKNIEVASATYSDERVKAKKPFLRKVRLITDLPNNIQTQGQEMTFEFTIYTPEPVKGACFSFQVVDLKERNFLHLWVFDSDQPMCRAAGEHVLRCRIPQLGLYMGNYHLKTYLSEPPGGEIFQVLDKICPFEVVMHGSQRQFKFSPNACAYIEKASWHINVN